MVHRPAAEARRQLFFAYGHFPWLLNRSGAVDHTFDRLVGGPGRPRDGDPLKAE